MRDHDAWNTWRVRREQLARQGLLGEHLDELEDHLRCEVEADSGGDGETQAIEAALNAALERLGAPNALAAEYRKAHLPMHWMPKFLGVACSLGVVLFALDLADLTQLVSPSALLLVGGFVAGGLCACFGPKRVARAVAVGLGAQLGESNADVEQLDAVAVRGQRLAWASGVIGFLLGLIAMAVNLSDPAQIGPAVAMSLMSLLYGALLAELGFGSLRSWLANRVTLVPQP